MSFWRFLRFSLVLKLLLFLFVTVVIVAAIEFFSGGSHLALSCPDYCFCFKMQSDWLAMLKKFKAIGHDSPTSLSCWPQSFLFRLYSCIWLSGVFVDLTIMISTQLGSYSKPLELKKSVSHLDHWITTFSNISCSFLIFARS